MLPGLIGGHVPWLSRSNPKDAVVEGCSCLGKALGVECGPQSGVARLRDCPRPLPPRVPHLPGLCSLPGPQLEHWLGPMSTLEMAQRSKIGLGRTGLQISQPVIFSVCHEGRSQTPGQE